MTHHSTAHTKQTLPNKPTRVRATATICLLNIVFLINPAGLPAQDQPPVVSSPSAFSLPQRPVQENPPQPRVFPASGIPASGFSATGIPNSPAFSSSPASSNSNDTEIGNNSLRATGQSPNRPSGLQDTDNQLIPAVTLPPRDDATMRQAPKFNAIQPVAYESTEPISTVTNNALPGSIEVVRELIQQFDLKHAPDPLAGQPLSLTDALREAPVTQRREMVVQYWETVGAWCRCRAAEAAVQELTRLPRAMSTLDQSLVASAEQLANNRWRKCQIDLLQNQAKLQSYLPVTGQSQMLPLPSDLPLMQTYETQHEQFSMVRPGDGNVSQIHLILPKQYQLMLDQGQAVQLTGNSSQLVTQSLAGGQATWSQWLVTETMYQDSVAELIDTVIEYNQQIARYSLSVAPMGQPADVAVAMLIVPERTTVPGGGLDSGVRQASLINGTGQNVTTGNSILGSQSGALSPNNTFAAPSSSSNSPNGFGGQMNSLPPAGSPFSASGFQSGPTATQPSNQNLNLNPSSQFQPQPSQFQPKPSQFQPQQNPGQTPSSQFQPQQNLTQTPPAQPQAD